MEKRDRIVEALKRAGVDGLVCFLPENVLFLSGYWPNTGRSSVVYPVEGEPVLIVPWPDLEFIPSGWNGETLEYGVGLDDQAPDQQVAALLKGVFEKRGLLGSRIGCERSFEVLAGTHIGGEVTVPGPPLFGLLEETMPGVVFECQTALIRELRMRKTPGEIEAMKVCQDIVAYALKEAKSRLHEGMKETEVAAIIESAIMTHGVGHRGVRRARGFAFVVSGPRSRGVYAWGPYNVSTERVLRKGDLVLIELDAYADGYWADLTRTFVVGGPEERQREIMAVVVETLEKVVESLKPGMKASQVGELARGLIRDAGYGDCFPHNIGHGVGFAFHEMPYLRPTSDTVLEAGMVLAIEPGIYVQDWGGIRVEDNVVITEEGGARYLSDLARGF
ncbi:MAG: aminopeptidase P family protein [Deltaproteobacteria bacterium]|nr:aminopeptidase P family protein [Deltaproteobacteria bacterium]